jgi:hypothetical protein
VTQIRLASILAAPPPADTLDPSLMLAVYLVFLVLELLLGLLALRASIRPKNFLLPAATYLLAVALPDPTWKGLLLLVSLLLMFFLAIRARFRKTSIEEGRELAQHGPTPWPGKSRQNSTFLIQAGIAMMVVGTVADAWARSRSILTVLLFACGALALGLGLVRSHAALVAYFGKKRARWLEVVQVSAGLAAYGLVVFGEASSDADQRLVFRLLTFIPFALHFMLVWIPLMKRQERAVGPANTQWTSGIG